MKNLKIYGASFLAFIVLDGLWLGWIAPSIYQAQLGHLMAPQPDWLAAAIFYPFFLLGILHFCVLPNLTKSRRIVLKQGFFYGVLTYATYELTNKAVLADWPWLIVPIDILWGGVLCAICSYVGWRVGQLK
jgi:uncharacterized membrane protein